MMNVFIGVTTSSSLDPTLANIFLYHHKTKWSKEYLKSVKPVYYKRYVDDSFVTFEKKHKSINFSFETEKKVAPFLLSMLKFVEKKQIYQKCF